MNSWPYVCDWDEDGRKDLLVGQSGIGGPCNVYVYLNQGTNEAPVFGDSTPVLANGQAFRSYRCIPVARDVDTHGQARGTQLRIQASLDLNPDALATSHTL